MQFSVKFMSLALLAPLASAHLMMAGQLPPAGESQAPLNPTGSDYPCTAKSYGGAAEKLERGKQAQVKILGVAVHGGGSCQISLSSDLNPTKSSKFHVIKSFQGGCPVTAAGNLPGLDINNPLPGLPFNVPDDVPSGKYVLAWTWFNRIGQREMYMRCKIVEVTGAGNGDKDKFSKRPGILRANIGAAGNGCSTPEGKNINFPSPGDQVQGKGDGAPSGNCGPSAAGGTPTDAPKPATPKPADNTPAKPATPAPASPAPAAPASGGSCSGALICQGEKFFALCASGAATIKQAVAAGTKCMNNAIVPA